MSTMSLPVKKKREQVDDVHLDLHTKSESYHYKVMNFQHITELLIRLYIAAGTLIEFSLTD